MTDTEAVEGLDEYIRNLTYGVGTTEEVKTLVAGNLRNFWISFCLPRVTLIVAAAKAERANVNQMMEAAQRTDIELRKKAEDKVQAMLEDIHAAWLALADVTVSDEPAANEAERFLVKWVKLA